MKLRSVPSVVGLLLCLLVANLAFGESRNPNTATFEKLDAITLSKIEFKDAPLSRVLKTLETLSEAEDPGPVVTGVQIIFPGAAKEDPRVNMKLRNIRLRSALELVTKSVGYTWDLDKGLIVVFKPKPGEAPPR